MIAIIFEVEPSDGMADQYLDIAVNLKPYLEGIDGFISIERFQSMTNDTKILSLSFFRDEAAVAEWRNLQLHRKAQSSGRQSVFDNYRLRVASVIRDYGIFDREQAPDDSMELHKK